MWKFLGRQRGIPPPAKPTVDERDFWIDPDPDTAGILLSDRIRFYVERVNLIFPFNEADLRPASYTLHAGADYLISLPGRLVEGNLERDGTVVIPPNGLIYIRFWEEVNIPHYLIARFNLRVKQVYRGLLLGTGPQVDPGFRGHLGCPIHNFTEEEKVLRFKDPLATIDFEKTTPFGQRTFPRERGKHKLTDAEIRQFSAQAEPVVGVGDLRCVLFGETSDRPLREYLPPGESVKSSVLALQGDVDKLKSQWSVFKAVAAGGAIVGLLAAGAIVFDAYRDLKTDIVNINKQLGPGSAGQPGGGDSSRRPPTTTPRSSPDTERSRMPSNAPSGEIAPKKAPGTQ